MRSSVRWLRTCTKMDFSAPSLPKELVKAARFPSHSCYFDTVKSNPSVFMGISTTWSSGAAGVTSERLAVADAEASCPETGAVLGPFPSLAQACGLLQGCGERLAGKSFPGPGGAWRKGGALSRPAEQTQEAGPCSPAPCCPAPRRRRGQVETRAGVVAGVSSGAGSSILRKPGCHARGHQDQGAGLFLHAPLPTRGRTFVKAKAHACMLSPVSF